MKIAKICENYNRQYGKSHNIDYRSVMPTNLYGPGDNYHPDNSHVIPALIHRFHEAKASNAKAVIAWGTGAALREFLHVDDMATASIHVMNLGKDIYDENTEPMLSHINVGTGFDCSINDLVQTIARVVEYKGKISFDISKPDGAPRKLMDVSRLKSLGWQHKISLEDGLIQSYKWFLSNIDKFRG